MSETSSPDAIEPASQNARDDSLGDALRRSLRQGAARLDTHLVCCERDIQIGNTKTKLHCYSLPLDGNGRVRMKPLAEFLRDQIIDYAIPRQTIKTALAQAEQTGSAAPIARLHETAKRLFTNLATTGEGGELLVFAMAEAVFGITQVICKMSLKTSTRVHYHGADGVYAEARPDGGLNLFWGESKVHGDPARAIRECLESLAPFLRDDAGADSAREQDLFLVNEFANFSDERLVVALKRFLDRDDPASLGVRHCGFALCAFDCSAYPDAETTMEAISESIKGELVRWVEQAQRRLTHEQLEVFDIHFICVPMPSADAFRTYFLELLGVQV